MSDPDRPEAATLDIPQGEGPGARIGPYRILQLIGEGGFGSVFEAEQDLPVKRRVALKIIKLGMDTREVIARFEAERQALALMDHPHIARVLDAGATDSGRPYFVMELVRGEPISKYCDGHGLSIRQRLALFQQVCGAVQHAHTKGIIHRDLKPNNVLVGTHDDQPFAKVIDFGIAKATSGRLTDKTMFTEAHLMMGTPLYMSPEQAEGSADIDTRTDIYSLGVILYELLTDTTPIDESSLRSAGFAEMQRIIREVDPPRPSARLSQSRKLRLGTASKDQVEPKRRARVVRGELDWIVMRAIEKDRSRRYETANGLAMDLRRYLAGEAVQAAPPSASYRLRKFVARNKGAVAAGSLIAATLLAGIAGFAWQAHVARKRAAELEQVSKFQADVLGRVDPQHVGQLLSDNVRAKFAASLEAAHVAESERAGRIAVFDEDWRHINATDMASFVIDQALLQPAASEIDAKFGQQPLVEASLRIALAEEYVGIGEREVALRQVQRARAIRRRELGADHADTLQALAYEGYLLANTGRFKQAEQSLREALAGQRRTLGRDDRTSLSTAFELIDLLSETGQNKEAEDSAREALETSRRAFGPDDPTTLRALDGMAAVLWIAGKSDQAEPYMRQALEGFRRAKGNDSRATLQAVLDLGLILRSERKLREAEPLFREALETSRRMFGEEHPETLRAMIHFGVTLQQEGKLDEAERYLRDGLEKSRRALPPGSMDILVAEDLYGDLLEARGRYAESDKLLAPVEPAFRAAFSADPGRMAGFLKTRGEALAGLGQFPAAQSRLLEAQAARAKADGALGEKSRPFLRALVRLYTAWDRADPGKGHDVQAAGWKTKLDMVDRAHPP